MVASNEDANCFVPVEQVKQLVLEQWKGPTFPSRFFDAFLYTYFRQQGTDLILEDDIPFLLRLAKINANTDESERQHFGSSGDFFAQFFKISDYTAIYFTADPGRKVFPAFLRNLFYYPEFVDQSLPPETSSEQYELLGITVITFETSIKRYMEQVVQRKKVLDRVRHSNFVNTASYMGNKKKIAGFIAEAMVPHVSKDCSFLDLMCGSGAMSQALAQLGVTYASDAQEFCQLLAKIQGRGFTRERAEQVLARIVPYYSRHFELLSAQYQEQLQAEASLYLHDWSDKEAVLSMYTEFASKFQLYSTTSPISKKLSSYIEPYKANHKKVPYCLFSLYFSNVFFGLLQCIQLDSLRYAVDQLQGDEKEWALGVLVVTVYQISSGHAGHFAQPKRISAQNILEVLSIRQKSAYHEFTKRFLCLSEESAACPHEIKTIPGPWQSALEFASEHISGQIMVYLDAPYKRDEYSRYYHVLETMVKYDYPASELKGRIRSKKLGERFSTEFFTKTSSKVEEVFVRIITDILSRGMICVWSYSDNGNASITNVISAVKRNTSCKTYLYSIQHIHRSQRGSQGLPVTEYCVIFLN